MKLFLLIFFSVTLMANNAFANPFHVNTYIEVQDISNLDLKNGTYDVDFYLIMEFPGDSMPEIEVMNGETLSMDTPYVTKGYSEQRIKAKLRTDFKYDYFPIDKQKLQIILESKDSSMEYILSSNPGQNIYADSIHLMGWRHFGINSESMVHNYPQINSTGKMERIPFSRISFSMPIERSNKWLYLTKILVPTLISIFIILIGFILSNEAIEPRMNISLGSLFVIVSNLVLTQNYLPEISTVTLIETLNYCSLFFVGIIIFLFAWSYNLREDPQKAKKIEVRGGIVAGLIYLGLIAYFIIT